MPSIFISHGAPTVVLEDNPTTKFFKQVSKLFPTPKAIIIVSAHWETKQHRITSALKPATIHDYYGFPEELYMLAYPASGSPELAQKIKFLVENGEMDSDRGFDHGAWNPLYLMYPKADIPVVQVSLKMGEGAEHHYKLGQKLKEFADNGYLVIGSGNLTHNLREAFAGSHSTTPTWVSDFSEWVSDNVARNNIDELLNWKQHAPFAKQNHPTDEHFMPFFVALGAGANNQAQRLNKVVDYKVLAMDSYIF